ncbi:MAG: FecR domain-containing protein [Deltaproteobacteria bacterium]|nr:FecR domain-containing protein [Deltaproteobacteria bacterium]
MRAYETLLRELAESEERELSKVDKNAALSLFVEEISRYPDKRRRSRRMMVAIAAGAAAILLALAVGMQTTDFFAPREIPQFGDLAEHQWIQVGPSATRDVNLEDGTQIQFMENSSGRVTQQIKHKGEVTLEKGNVTLSVPHRADSDWKVLAGPYKVAVTGTQFEVKWNPQGSDLTVNVFRGSVMVTGPLLEKGQSVTSRRSLSANLHTSSVKMTPLDKNYTAGDLTYDDVNINNTAEDANLNNTLKRNSHSSTSKHSKRHGAKDISNGKGLSNAVEADKSGTSWVEKLDSGDYSSVASEIQRIGLAPLLQDTSPAVWLRLGNAARLAGDYNTARAVYERLRRQFPGSGYATTAALYMGRMAFDQQKQYAQAAKWFNIYLSEQKGGTLHREVLGRLMETQYKAQMRTEAMKTAQRYLEEYPNGPHAARARELLEQ